MLSPTPTEDPDLREIGDEAIWTLSTAKPGSGIDKLLDNNVETFWQSDGPQPHFVNVQFTKKMRVSEVRLYVSLLVASRYLKYVSTSATGKMKVILQVLCLCKLGMVSTICRKSGSWN
eukprot:GEMP01087109.1.p1 GENE.GEMP01087109.1~~GEMP01087109.1.p1  ORF type:complete len:118 (+),score=7.51 GEMP01087109.1:57-410(+)